MHPSPTELGRDQVVYLRLLYPNQLPQIPVPSAWAAHLFCEERFTLPNSSQGVRKLLLRLHHRAAGSEPSEQTRVVRSNPNHKHGMRHNLGAVQKLSGELDDLQGQQHRNTWGEGGCTLALVPNGRACTRMGRRERRELKQPCEQLASLWGAELSQRERLRR